MAAFIILAPFVSCCAVAMAAAVVVVMMLLRDESCRLSFLLLGIS